MSYAMDPVQVAIGRARPVRVTPALARRLRMGDAYQSYRAGERADYTDAPGYTPVDPVRSVPTMTAEAVPPPVPGYPVPWQAWVAVASASVFALMLFRGQRR
jgi:hypothetical protein